MLTQTTKKRKYPNYNKREKLCKAVLPECIRDGLNPALKSKIIDILKAEYPDKRLLNFKMGVLKKLENTLKRTIATKTTISEIRKDLEVLHYPLEIPDPY